MLKRLLNIIKGWFGLGIRSIENSSPEALLENEKNNLRDNIAKFNSALAKHAGNLEKLMHEEKQLGEEEADLRKKIKVLIEADKREIAQKMALKLQDVDKRHDEKIEQLDEVKNQYEQLTKARDTSVKAATEKIEQLSASIDDMNIKSAAAELTETATGMVTSIGSSGDSISRITEMVDERRNLAAGKARVATDSLGFGELENKQAEEEALAEIALTKIESEMGLNTEKV